MSGPFKASADDVRRLADFLDGMSALTERTGVSACVYMATDVELPSGSTVKVSIVTEDGSPQYVVDDRIGD
jgi:hypothetical protein